MCCYIKGTHKLTRTQWQHVFKINQKEKDKMIEYLLNFKLNIIFKV